MGEPSYTGTVSGLKVTERIDGAHPTLTDYPLLPGDLIIGQPDGTFYKFGPGLGVTGFELTPEQILTCESYEDTDFAIGGVDFFFNGDGAA